MAVMKPQTPIINRNHPLSRGLIFDVPFFEGAGTIARDKVNNIPGSIIASGATWNINKYGQCLDFSAAVSSVSYTAPVALNSMTLFSMEALVYPRSIGATNGRIFHKGPPSGPYLVAFATGNKIFFNAACSTTSENVYSVVSMNLNAWNYIVVTYDGSIVSNAPNIYINGVLSGNTVNTTGVGTHNTDDTNLYIGNRSDGLRNWDGKISYVRFRNYIMNAQEVMSLYINPWIIYQRINRIIR